MPPASGASAHFAEDALARMAPIAERSPFAAGTALTAMCELLGEE